MQLSIDPNRGGSSSNPGSPTTQSTIPIDGPAPDSSLVTWDIPYAPEDPKKTNKLRFACIIV